MFEEYKITQELRKLKEVQCREEFLKILRRDLEFYIDKNSEKEKKKFGFFSAFKSRGMNFSFFNGSVFGRYNFAAKAAIIFLFALVFGLTGAGLASQDSLPGEPLYSIKAFTENIRYSFAVSSESKARLNMDFTNERLNEIKQMFEEKGIEAEGLDVALSRLDDNAKRTAELIQEEKEKGGDVSEFAEEMHEEIKQYQADLNQTFEDRKKFLETEKDELKSKIEEAKKIKDETAKKDLDKKLSEINLRKKILEAKKDQGTKIIERQKENLKNELNEKERRQEIKKDLEAEINKLEKEMAEYTDEAAKDNIVIPSGLLNKFNDVFTRVRAYYIKEDYFSVEKYVKESEDVLSDIGKFIDKPEKGEEDEDIREKSGENNDYIDEKGDDDGKNSSFYKNASYYYERMNENSGY